MTARGMGTTPTAQDLELSGGQAGELRKHLNLIERKANGLRRLNTAHKKIAQLHAGGMRNRDIANALGYDDAYISILLSDPLMREEIGRIQEETSQSFDGMYSLAIDAIRDGLMNPDPQNSLRAAAIYFKERQERESRKIGGGKETAEDIISRMINVQVNINNSSVGVQNLNGDENG